MAHGLRWLSTTRSIGPPFLGMRTSEPPGPPKPASVTKSQSPATAMNVGCASPLASSVIVPLPPAPVPPPVLDVVPPPPAPPVLDVVPPPPAPPALDVVPAPAPPVLDELAPPPVEPPPD